MSAAAAAPEVPIRDAATVILLRRDRGEAPSVLMGMRGAAAAFMASKYVFPGGAVDDGDDAADDGMADPRLMLEARDGSRVTPAGLLGCARRELEEETGLRLLPDAAVQFVFRAITPPGRPRRFDARFFVVDAADVTGDPDDFSAAEDELSHLHWVPLTEARRLDLPFITEVVLAEVAALAEAAGDGPLPRPATVPFFDNRTDEPRFCQIGAEAPSVSPRP
ncbi:NUDIX domain-containing protein [Paracoccus sp. S-4012]|uniref:NUDIX domain-containing protein n=1 Tax=Paracoccus sp. S-4012 TaxID=2665648 RepID=UPI0012AF2320|nr:NUDIX domain-containing protein [Paracoccus sp. S-4012]MRX51268.1 NUDIX domain-containing protein [Paracoccus sp. S-4012]